MKHLIDKFQNPVVSKELNPKKKLKFIVSLTRTHNIETIKTELKNFVGIDRFLIFIGENQIHPQSSSQKNQKPNLKSQKEIIMDFCALTESDIPQIIKQTSHFRAVHYFLEAPNAQLSASISDAILKRHLYVPLLFPSNQPPTCPSPYHLLSHDSQTTPPRHQCCSTSSLPTVLSCPSTPFATISRLTHRNRVWRALKHTIKVHSEIVIPLDMNQDPPETILVLVVEGCPVDPLLTSYNKTPKIYVLIRKGSATLQHHSKNVFLGGEQQYSSHPHQCIC